MEELQDLLIHLDKGDFEYCLMSPKSSIPRKLNKYQSLFDILKNIARKQQKLELENKRYQMAFQQQQQLLTPLPQEDDTIVNNLLNNTTIPTPEEEQQLSPIPSNHNNQGTHTHNR